MSRTRARTAAPVATLLALSTAVLGLTAPAASAAPSSTAPVVINEVYGGGGNSGSTFTHDFVELHNTTSSPVDVGSWSVQYASAGGTSWTNKTNLTGQVIPAGGRLLVKGAAGTTPGSAAAFTADVDGSTNLSATAGKVALVDNQTSLPSSCTGTTNGGTNPCSLRSDVVDFVGYGTANDFAGSGPAPAPANGTSVSRDAAQRNTASNAADLRVGAPTPCGQASCTEATPAPGEEPGGGSGTDVTIAQIQGTTNVSPLAGQSVSTTGVVTASYPTGGFSGFVLQTGGTGGPRSTSQPSDGLFVFTGAGNPVPALGASVRVSGTVGDFFGLTQLTAPTVTALAEPLPPVTPSTTDGWPRTDAERESLESVLYRPTGAYTVTNTFATNQFGEVGLAFGTSPLLQPTEVAPARSATATAVAAENSARSVPLDDGATTNFLARSGGRLVNGALTPPYVSQTAPVRIGAAVTFTAPVVVDYRNGAFKLQPTSQVVGPQNTGAPATFADTRTAAPDAALLGDADLSVASFNVLNHFTTLGEKTAGCLPFTDRDGNGVTVSSGCDVRGAWRFEDYQRQQEKIVTAITALDADVVGLMEIENSARLGEPADEAVQTLVAALNDRAGAPVWAANPSSAELGDVSQQDVITNAIVYKVDAVERVGAARALSREAAPAFVNARNPIAQVFAPVGGGAPFLFVVNHFKSKGSAGPLPGDADQGDFQGRSNASRVAQAEALRDWVPTVQAGARAVVMVGDYNAYSQEDPLQVLYSAGYTNAEAAFGNGEYSYSFSGLSGSLDHVLLNDAALGRATGTDIWNINSGESLALEYSRFNTHGTDFHAPDAYRSSDHDPVVVGLRAAGAPVPVQLLATNDFHGRLQASGAEAGAAVLAGAVKQLRAAQPNTVFAAAGDLIGASTFESFIAQDKPTIDALNEAGLEVSAVGNHELDAGYRDLVDRVSKDASWTYVAANLRLKETGDPAVPATWIKDLAGVQVGFVGAVTEDLPSLVSPAGIAELEVTAIVPSVNAATADLKREGADVVVLLVHEGSPTSSCADVTGDNAFGRIVGGLSDDVDAVVSGHTHLAYTCQVPVPGWADRAVTTRPVVSAGQYGTNLNQLLLSVDPDTGRLLSQSAALLPLAGRYAPDTATKKIVDDAVAQAAVLGARVLGQTTGALNRAQRLAPTPQNPAALGENRGGESTLGNLVAEVQRRAAGTQIAVMNPGGLRADLAGPGDVTFRQAANVQPFANTLVRLTLTGAQVKTLLEQQWQPTGASRPFLRLGLSEGLTYTYDPAAARDQRVREIRLDGVVLDPAGRYTVAANSFLAGGGDNFAVLAQGTDRRDTGKIDLQAFVDELAARGTLTPDRTQRSVGVRFPADAPATYAPGDTVRLDVSSLSFTSAADVLDSELVATLGGTELGRFPVSTVRDGSLFDEAGTASVSVTVPAGTTPGDVPLVLTGATTGTRAVVPLTVARRASSVLVRSDAPTATLGAPVTLTATVTGGVTGTVQFLVDGTPVGAPVAVVGGRATSAPVRGLAVGTYGVSATYSGDSGALPSTSPALAQHVRYAVAVLSPVAGDGKDPKAGSELPVRFRLTDVQGAPISDAEASALGARVTVAAGGAQTLAPTPAGYDPGKASKDGKPVKDKELGVFAVDWRTEKGRTGEVLLTLTVAFDDGPAQVTEVPVTLR